MYNFIFSFFYRYFNKRNDLTPRFSAALAVALTVFFHLFLFANLITFFTDINLAGKPFSQDYSINKLYLMPFGIVYVYSFVFFYNRKRAMAILSKYPTNYKWISVKNILLILLIMIMPFLLGIQFLQHSN
jgi:hypothetical protein